MKNDKIKEFQVLNICKIVFYILAFANLIIMIYELADSQKITNSKNIFLFFIFLTVGEAINCIVYIAENKTSEAINILQQKTDPTINDRCYNLTINFSAKDVKEIKNRANMRGYENLQEYAYNLVKNDVESVKRVNIIDDFPPRL